MSNPPPFSFKSPNYYEQLQLEFAGLASDMRMLGFNEETIKLWIKKMWSIESRKAVKEAISYCKQIQKEYSEFENDRS